jgi:hypothetical protein
MKYGPVLAAAVGCVAMVGVLMAQRPFREYPAWEYNNFPLPKDYMVPGEWTFARLMYPTTHYRIDWQSELKRGLDWRDGNTNWTIDYPRSDRHLSEALRRLTRVHVRSVEQPVNLDDGNEVYHWPWLYAVEVGHWNLTDAQAKVLREYLLRGGFFMCDDFHGTEEWEVFAASMSRVFPDRPIVEIENKDQIFHTLYDLDDRYQVPGAQYIRSGSLYEFDGVVPHWRGIYDDKGRLMVAICFDMDLGDSWEHADNPEYPEKFSALGIRIGANYLIYAMTH